MSKYILSVLLLTVLGVGGGYVYSLEQTAAMPAPTADFVETEAGFEEVIDVDLSSLSETELRELVAAESSTMPYEREDGRIYWSNYWLPFTPAEAELYGRIVREPGPPRVGVQIGHWQNYQVPEELSGLTRNGSGAVGGGVTELQLVEAIGRALQVQLEAEGVVVDLLPATVPIDYYADAFVSIHADGNANTAVRGYKIAGPRYDFSGQSEALATALTNAYGVITGLPEDDNITRRMSGYYAFNWRRYDHALHPLTPAAIVETGFVTNPTDRALLLNEPERVARAIAAGLFDFLAIRN